jgi:formylglycine-generating enzyme
MLRRTTTLALSCLVTLVCAPACTGGGGGPASEEETGYDEGDGLGDGECADVCGTPGCGSCPQAAMVDGGGFMIDAGEVSNGQYAALLEVDFDATVLPSGCAWKSGFRPMGWSDQLDPTLPVVGVDWCDAAVFCAWAGKRLCGEIGGGPASWSAAEDADGDMWYRACSDAGTKVFPYGSAYEPETCNGSDAGLDGLGPAGSLPGCEGGVAGLFDMSGNVWEWTDACEQPEGDANTQCRRRGGSRYSDADNLRCGVNSRRARGERDNAVGFRCCTD